MTPSYSFILFKILKFSIRFSWASFSWNGYMPLFFANGISFAMVLVQIFLLFSCSIMLISCSAACDIRLSKS